MNKLLLFTVIMIMASCNKTEMINDCTRDSDCGTGSAIINSELLDLSINTIQVQDRDEYIMFLDHTFEGINRDIYLYQLRFTTDTIFIVDHTIGLDTLLIGGQYQTCHDDVDAFSTFDINEDDNIVDYLKIDNIDSLNNTISGTFQLSLKINLTTGNPHNLTEDIIVTDGVFEAPICR